MSILKSNSLQLFATVMMAFSVLFTSCSKDDADTVDKPVITDMEVGSSNSHVGYIGSDLHVEAEIEASGKIKSITIAIHKEDGSGWTFSENFDDYSGQLNATFHKHIDIPADAATGSYHFHFTVTDMQGNQTTVEEELELEVSSDTEAPVITISNAPTANQEFSKGQRIGLSVRIADNMAVGGVMVALVRAEDTNPTPSTVIMMRYESFQDINETDFEASINAGAEYDNQATPVLIQGDNAWRSGDYYIFVRTWDGVGNVADSQKHPVKIKL